MEEKEKNEEKKDEEMEENTETEEKKDEEMEENTETEENKTETKEKKMEIKEKKMVQVGVEKEESVEKDEAKKNEVENNDAEIAMAHVVTDAEKREQPEARRKGVELLHFVRTLTETLCKASMPKEVTLLQKIQEAEMEAAARKEEKEAACNEKAMRNDTVEESTAHENDDQAIEATAFDSHASSSKTANDESLVPGFFHSRAYVHANRKTHEHLPVMVLLLQLPRATLENECASYLYLLPSRVRK
ncbi:unnamed protein product [Peronospora destructor]|uniref:Uncharacterized protein n=1 Tax=Peronospora destructor TaxID=86335 RepID=A0AAV0VAZ3_9STRA|nr:unnamed protein product [Peronospora destructor]